MTREEFIQKVPNITLKDKVIQLVDEGIKIYKYDSEKKQSYWYAACAKLLSDSSNFLPSFQQCLADRLDTGRYLLYCAAADVMNDFVVMDKAEDVKQRILKILKDYSTQAKKDNSYQLMSVSNNLIKALSITYYAYYEYRDERLTQMIAEYEDEIAFQEIANQLNGDNPKGKSIDSIKVNFFRARGLACEFHSEKAIKLFKELIFPQFYDRYGRDPMSITELKAKSAECAVAKDKLNHRVIHEMYKIFVDEGLVKYGSDEDLYKLGSKNGKFVSANNQVSYWIYEVFQRLSGKYKQGVDIENMRKAIRDILKSYASPKYYHKDDVMFPENFERVYRVYLRYDEENG